MRNHHGPNVILSILYLWAKLIILTYDLGPLHTKTESQREEHTEDHTANLLQIWYSTSSLSPFKIFPLSTMSDFLILKQHQITTILAASVWTKTCRCYKHFFVFWIKESRFYIVDTIKQVMAANIRCNNSETNKFISPEWNIILIFLYDDNIWRFNGMNSI